MTAAAPTPSLCIGVLTLNEAQRIRQCLESARFAQQLIVIDSGSTDGTADLARELGAQVHVYPDWRGFAEQRNRLLQHVQADYVFFLDADEVITPELRQEMQAALASGQTAIWRVVWEQVAFGQRLRWMKGGGGLSRLFPVRHLRGFDGVVHENPLIEPPGLPEKVFKHKLLHYSRETVYASLLKLAQYVQLGALKRARQGKRGGVLRGLLSGAANFFRLYILGRGFMCGRAGFLFCFFIALECFFRYVALETDRDTFDTTARR